MKRTDPTFADRATDAAVRGFLGLASLLPYRWRIPAMGWVAARIAAPIAGWDKRVLNNLSHVWPDLPEAERKRLARAVPDNFGRMMAEVYAGDAFAERVRDLPITGPGAAALEEAHKAKRPVLLATGHFGNYEAFRVALLARGYPVGGLYNPMSNPLFNDHYVAAMSRIGTPLFPRGRAGLADMVRFLRGGGVLGIVADQYMRHGEPMDFLGQPARTALSAAQLALKYDALLLPSYGIRQPDGLSFELRMEEPIPHSTAEAMTQAMNDSLGALVHEYPEQWFWIHRRWK